MTTIQVFALLGVFLIGVIGGGYGVYKFFIFALDHCTVVGLEVGKCGNPLCDRRHLKLSVLNATASLGISSLTLTVDTVVGDALETALARHAAEMAIPPPPD